MVCRVTRFNPQFIICAYALLKIHLLKRHRAAYQGSLSRPLSIYVTIGIIGSIKICDSMLQLLLDVFNTCLQIVMAFVFAHTPLGLQFPTVFSSGQLCFCVLKKHAARPQLPQLFFSEMP